MTRASHCRVIIRSNVCHDSWVGVVTCRSISIASSRSRNTKHCSSLLMGACQFIVAFQNMGVIYVNRSIRHTSSKYFIIFQLLWSDGFRVFTWRDDFGFPSIILALSSSRYLDTWCSYITLRLSFSVVFNMTMSIRKLDALVPRS